MRFRKVWLFMFIRKESCGLVCNLALDLGPCRVAHAEMSQSRSLFEGEEVLASKV